MSKLDTYTPHVHSAARKRANAHVKSRCNRCRGSGDAPCTICGGKGEVLQGKTMQGGPIFARCQGCYGRRVTRCACCSGEGFV
ncbi:hypothetical protein EI983_11585 [Roseovarius faecimaris]|uniref:Uncharacterized protein n=1 Tax=Roseovarius faecimaris TaxID=2494550 RepID=A0A6I6J281_9RHOB|nr:hypothetical protein [Roseovarius faecimaris]QGX98878.1 hypothetical protein EI983_11585 [Roseovarius faecimaris]